MYKIGDFVVYGTSGVCRIAEIGTPQLSNVDKNKQYFTLAPVYSTEIIYAPVDTRVFMRPVMTRDEAEELIGQIPEIGEERIDIKNLQLLTERYQASFQAHNCVELVHLIKSIHMKNTNASRRGKKPSTVDQRYQKRAEELLHGELAVALGIPLEAVPSYIQDRVGELDVSCQARAV